jgi:Vitelline membrane outer layer protein I (VOMI)
MNKLKIAVLTLPLLLAVACSNTPKPEISAQLDCGISLARLPPGEGCPPTDGGGGGGGTPTYTTIISDKAHVLNDLTKSNVVSYSASTGDLKIRKGGKFPQAFAVGQIIISEPATAIPYGLEPVTVTTVAEDTEFFYYKTQTSALEDIILQGKAEVDEYVKPSDISQFSLESSNGFRTQEFSCTSSSLTLTCNFTSNNNTKGKITFKLRKTFALEFTNGLKLTRFKAAVGVDQRTKIEFTDQNPSTNLNISELIGRFKIAQFTIKIAGVPIVINMGVDLRFNTAGQVTSTTNYTLNQNVTFVKGLEYNRSNGWTDLEQRAYGMSLNDTTTGASVRNGRLSADISAIPNIRFFANAQLELGSAKLYSKIELDPANAAQDMIRGGIEFCSTVNFRLWTWTLPVYSGTCRDYELWRNGVISAGNVTLFDPLDLVGTLNASGGGAFGTWKDWEYCPQDSYASGFQLKVEGRQGSGDDTGLNGIQLRCADRTGIQLATVTSGQSAWGAWSTWSSCTTGQFLAAYSLLVEPPQGGNRDDTGANNLRMACKSSNNATVTNFFEVSPTPGQSWGNWGSWQTVAAVPNVANASNVAICGLRTKTENNQFTGDDTALNDVEFAYCAY